MSCITVLVTFHHLVAKTQGQCSEERKVWRTLYKMFVSMSWKPASSTTSTCIPLVAILSRGSKPTAKAAGACGLPVCPRRQTVWRPHITVVLQHSVTGNCPPATAATAATASNAVTITGATPNPCRQAPFVISVCTMTYQLSWGWNCLKSQANKCFSYHQYFPFEKERVYPPRHWAAPAQTLVIPQIFTTCQVHNHRNIRKKLPSTVIFPWIYWLC